jgi:hypothetical protein
MGISSGSLRGLIFGAEDFRRTDAQRLRDLLLASAGNDVPAFAPPTCRYGQAGQDGQIEQGQTPVFTNDPAF